MPNRIGHLKRGSTLSAVTERIPFVTGKMIAKELVSLLDPLCQKLEIAGSVRRLEPEIGDIKIVCVPHYKQVITGEDLFEKEVEYQNRVITWIEDLTNSDVQKVKGGEKCQQFIYKGTYQVDLFMVAPREWGRQLAIRTGPASYSKKMAARWVMLGYHGINGRLINDDGIESPSFPTEEDFFEFLNWNYVEPSKRG